jgi:hypothetical protein
VKAGDLVKVKTKHYGVKIVFLAEKIVDSWGESWIVSPTDHPRDIIAEKIDLRLVSSA